jgi:signal transduction histidine kinase
MPTTTIKEWILQKLFQRSRTDYQRALTEFSRSLTLIVDFEQLLENLVGKLREIAEIPNILILLRDLETNRFTVADSRGTFTGEKTDTLIFSPEDKLVRWLTINETPLIVPKNPGVVDYFSKREHRLLSEYSIQIIVPLLVMNRVTGMVFLGSKKNDEPFSKEEMELLTTLLSQSALAFENALLYQEQKQRLRKMFRADRLATIGQIAAGAAHEIRNPLTSIRSTIQYLKKKNQDSDQEEMLGELMGEVDRIDEIIHGLLSFSKPVQPQKEKVQMDVLLKQILTLTASTARKNHVQVQFEPLKEPVITKADPSQMKQVFLNIILNAIQAMGEGGNLIIQMERIKKEREKKKENYYLLKFQDTGTGISEEQLECIFDPFYTTKKEGTGLGLSISYGIVQQHGGEIEVSSRTKGKQKGTTVTVLLPGG